MNSEFHCEHTCKGLCTALDLAMQEEQKTILKYAFFRDECNYPDVKLMLNELIIQRQKSIELLVKTRQLLNEKFEVLDQVREGFEM